MVLDRTGKVVIAITLFVAALLIAQIYVSRDAPLKDWWLPAALAIIGGAVALLAWLESRGAPPAPYSEAEALPEKRAHIVAATPEAAGSPPEPAAEPVAPPIVAAAAPTEPDDLTRIEGIGPKMSAALVAAGIDTFARLADTPEEDLRAAIRDAGMRLAPSLPTWAEQAAIALRGDWDALKKFQSELTAGRRGS